MSNESSTDFSVHTPELNPAQPGKAKTSRNRSAQSAEGGFELDDGSSRDDTNLPNWKDVEGIRATDWSEIEDIDAQRALAKAVYHLEPGAAAKLATLLNNLHTRKSREKCIVDCLAALSSDDFFAEGIPSKHQETAKLLVLLYLTHYLGRNALDFGLSSGDINKAYEDKDTALGPFYGTLGDTIQALFNNLAPHKGKKRKRTLPELLSDDSDLDASDDISSGSLPDDIPPPPHKKRKRKVEESQEAMSQQYSDKIRIRQQELRRQNLAEKFASIQADGTAQVIVNTEEPLVHLHEQIAVRIKPHQVNGLQFMWWEIIEDNKHQGCILAHTMGLGKTMQVVISSRDTVSMQQEQRFKGQRPDSKASSIRQDSYSLPCFIAQQLA